MVPTAWIYLIEFEFWSPQVHQHLCLHSTCDLNNKTYPLTPDLHWHQYLHLCILWIHATSINRMSSSLCTCYPLYHYCTFPVYPLLELLPLPLTTYTTWPSYSLLRYLLLFFANHNLGFIGRPYYRLCLWHDVSSVWRLSVVCLWRFVLWQNGVS